MDVCGAITSDTTWTLADSPYQVTCTVTVLDGVTLTVEAGVQVVFAQGQSLRVYGNLVAVGTASQPILFRGAESASGYWGNLTVGGGNVSGDSDASRLSYVTIEGAGYYVSGSLMLISCTPTLDHLTIRNGSGPGLYAFNTGPFTLDTATIENNAGHGIRIGQGNGEILSSLTVRNNVGYGIHTDDSPLGLTLRHSTISGNAVAARLPVSALLEDITVSGNSRNEIEWAGGAITVDRTWPRLSGLSAYRLTTHLTIDPATTLTIEPGVQIVSEACTYIWVYGTLTAVGNISAPITFTAAADAGPQGWSGLWFVGGTGRLRNVRVGNVRCTGTNAISSYNGALVTIEQSQIVSNTTGIYIQSGHPVILGNQIAGNDSYGVRNESDTDIDAIYNWWGAPSGPHHPASNPGGQGDQVSDGVEFRPWQTTHEWDPWTARQPITLSLGMVIEDTIIRSAFRDYAVPVRGGVSLLVQATPLTGTQSLRLMSRSGQPPSLAAYDAGTEQLTLRGTYDLMLSPTQGSTYYFALFGNEVASPQGAFRIEARIVERYVTDVVPRSGGNAGPTTLQIQGTGLVEGMQVELWSASLPSYAAGQVTLLSASSLAARFDLAGATPGAYNLRIIWPGGETEVLDAAFRVTSGLGSHLEATLHPAQYVRTGRLYPIELKYQNTGDGDMVAPIFVISGPDDTPLRLSPEDPFEIHPVQVLGINPSGATGILSPGVKGSARLHFIAPSRSFLTPFVDFKLEVMVADDTPIDWDAVESEVRPADVDPEVWDIFWPMLTAQVGATWADYNRVLADDATYLSTLGRTVYSVRDLFRFEARKALGLAPRPILADAIDASCPAPGPALRFGRVFPGTLEGRFYLGPLGRGWSHDYDITLEELSDGSVRGHWPGGFYRLFRRNADGTYTALFGDHARLVKDAGLFVLTEKDATVYRFRSDGKLDTIQNGNGNRISATYNGSGQLVQVSHSSGDSFTLGYSSQGRIATLTDQSGRVTGYGYDASGEHLLTVTTPGGRVTSYTYDPAASQPSDHALLSAARPDGTHQYYAYDSQGRLSAEWRDGDAERVTYDYAAANRIAITDAHGQTAFIFPDEFGRPARLKDALGNQLDLSFDAQFNLSRITDPAGQPYRLTYDNLGNPIGAEDPLADRITLGYDYRFSRLALLRDARANESGFTYDNAGNLTTLTYPDGSREIITYDTAGNPLTYTDRAGQTTAYTHNARGQLTRKDYPDGSWAAYTYDAAGNMTSAADPSGTITMTYDPATNWLTRVTYPTGQYFAYTYNAAGQRAQRVDQDGRQLNYAYDAAGRLVRTYDESNADIVQYAYDAAGRLERKTLGNGTYATYEYDAAGQIIHLVHHKADATILSRFNYTYDVNGNRTSMTTLDGTTTYTYDPLGQLTGASYPGGRQVTYAYDAAGNRTVVTENGTPTSYTTNALNQYTQVGAATYTYDANGSLASVTEDAQTTRYFYDYENRLVRVETPSATVTYSYDPLGRRIARTDAAGAVRYLLDGDHVAAELDATNAVTARYVHGAAIDEVLLMERGGNDYWYNLDALGSVRNLTAADGHMLESYDYDAYGQPSAGSSVGNPLFFAARECDSLAGLQHTRARHYSYSLGRFIEPDPIGIAGGSNLYAYVMNNPVNQADPSGLGGIHDPTNSRTPEQWRKNAEQSRKLRQIDDFISQRESDLDRASRRSDQDKTTDMAPQDVADRARLADLCSRGALCPLLDTRWAHNVTPRDPNEKLGPTGVGDDHLVSNDEELQYTVYFENQASATAPAQEVFITDTLDANLDWTTFRPIEIAFGDTLVPISDGTLQYADRQTVTDYRADVDKSWWVDIAVEANPFKGKAVWTFRTLDPDTGELPEDALAGFLPPEDGSGRGQGHVTFGIRPRSGLPDGTRLANQASIVFDTNDPISTNEVWNKTTTPGHLDAGESDMGIELTWLHLSSQVDHYEVYRSTNPYFTPGGADSQKLDDVALPEEFSELSYEDAEGLTPPVTGYYYVVCAVKANGEIYFTSNRAGAFGFGLTPGGW